VMNLSLNACVTDGDGLMEVGCLVQKFTVVGFVAGEIGVICGQGMRSEKMAWTRDGTDIRAFRRRQKKYRLRVCVHTSNGHLALLHKRWDQHFRWMAIAYSTYVLSALYYTVHVSSPSSPDPRRCS
jgi:hypothetical protein